MLTLYLHGNLGKKYGKRYDLAVSDVVQAVQLVAAQKKGFRQDFRDGSYRVVRGKCKTGVELTQDMLRIPVKDEVHLIPAVKGAGKSGGGKLILGAAIMTGAIVASGGTAAGGLLANMGGTAFTVAGASVTYGNVAMIGFSMALAGAAIILSPQLAADYNKRQATAPSFVYNGPTNTTGQGMPVPVVYGRVLIGSAVISSGVSIEALPVNWSPPNTVVYNSGYGDGLNVESGTLVAPSSGSGSGS